MGRVQYYSKMTWTFRVGMQVRIVDGNKKSNHVIETLDHMIIKQTVNTLSRFSKNFVSLA